MRKLLARAFRVFMLENRRVAFAPFRSYVIAGMFMAISEGQLGYAGFIEFAETFYNHQVVLQRSVT